MENVEGADARPDSISIARCRELLGHESIDLLDEDVDLIRQHANAMAHVLVQIFFENRATPE